MSNAPAPRSARIHAGGVFIPDQLCEPIYRVLHREIQSRRNGGGDVRPEILELCNNLRAAALEQAQSFMSANGQRNGHLKDFEPLSEQALTTGQMATHLGVDPRHARRIAAAAGVQPIARNVWAESDVAQLVALRRRTNVR